MKVRCPNCKEIFIADNRDQKLLTTAIQKGQQLLIIECSKCYKDVPINPMDLMTVKSQIGNSIKEKYDGQNCPICSDGIISFIENKDEKFWGCGECGNVWYNKTDLDILLKNS